MRVPSLLAGDIWRIQVAISPNPPATITTIWAQHALIHAGTELAVRALCDFATQRTT